MSCNLKEYKEFIDNEMLLILGQMDKATLIFDHVYLVRKTSSLSVTSTKPKHSVVFNLITVILLSFIINYLCRAPSGTLPTWKSCVTAGEL